MNQLKVSTQQSILALVARGWSQRRISRELELDRETVARHVKLAAAKPATYPALGSGNGPEAKPASNLALGSEAKQDSKPASNPALGVRPGPPSLCAPFALQIETALQAGLSAQRIYQDLVREHGFKGA